MQVKIGKKAGFCMGVRRALKETLQAVSQSPNNVFTYGPLIHNSQVVELLERRNIKSIDNPKDISPGNIIVVRAHGVPPEIIQKIKNAGGKIWDATCPHVKRAQLTVKKAVEAGAHVIIVGDRGHAEVAGLLGYAGGKGFVVENIEDVENLPPLDCAWVVAQTTQSYETFQNVSEAIKKKIPRVEVARTICGSTTNRQNEVLNLSKEVDVMIVVGGKHSANTIRLAELAKKVPVPTVHIETAEELDLDYLKKFKTAGITAGASTPNWIIEEVIEKLQNIHMSFSVLTWFRIFFSFIMRSHLFLSLGAAALTMAACSILQLSMRNILPLLSGLYLFSMQNLNMYLEHRHGELIPPNRRRIYEKFSYILAPLGIISSIASLILALIVGKMVFLFLSLSTILGLFYSIRILPAHWHYKRLKDIPGSKNLFFAGAISVVTVLIPAISQLSFKFPQMLIALLYVASIAFIRSITLDLQESQNDQFAGRETIPMLIGSWRIKILGSFILFACTATFFGFALFDKIPFSMLFHLFTIGYIMIYLWLYRQRIFSKGMRFEFIVDFSLYIPLLATLIIKYVQ